MEFNVYLAIAAMLILLWVCNFSIEGMDNQNIVTGLSIKGGPYASYGQILCYDINGNILQYQDYQNITSTGNSKSFATPDVAFDGNYYYTWYPHVWRADGQTTTVISADLVKPQPLSKIVIYCRSDYDTYNQIGAVLTVRFTGDMIYSKAFTNSEVNSKIITVDLTSVTPVSNKPIYLGPNKIEPIKIDLPGMKIPQIFTTPVKWTYFPPTSNTTTNTWTNKTTLTPPSSTTVIKAPTTTTTA
jgi:hypothetical protein